MRMLRPDQVATRLAVCTRTVYRLVTDGKLIGLRVGNRLRIPEDSVTQYINRQIELLAVETGTYLKKRD